ncbi:MAG: hypothetical protein V3W14_03730 [Candidatus Neomarinimicrobiota bacterium]
MSEKHIKCLIIFIIISAPWSFVFSSDTTGVNTQPEKPRFSWGSSFGGAFNEDKFNFLESAKASYRLREPLILNRPGISQDITLGFLWTETTEESEPPESYNFLFYVSTRFHKDIFKFSTEEAQLRLSVFAGGGLGHSTTYVTEKVEPYEFVTEDVLDYRGLGFLLTAGGRLEYGPYYGETSWNLRDAEPRLLNTISIGIQSKSPIAALVVPACYYFVFKIFHWTVPLLGGTPRSM